jgi:hypothetical protein
MTCMISIGLLSQTLNGNCGDSNTKQQKPDSATGVSAIGGTAKTTTTRGVDAEQVTGFQLDTGAAG